MPQPITLNGVDYKSSAAAIRAIKERIAANTGVAVKPTDEDYSLFLEVAKQHKRRGWYMSGGVKEFRCSSGNALQVVRNDGQVLDLSYSKCVTKKEVDKLTAAMRTAIVMQIKDFKARHFEADVTRCSNPRCKTAATPLTDATCHIDHDNEFIKLKEDFMTSELKKNIPKSFEINKNDGVYRKNAIMFKDNNEAHKAFKERWQEYHLRHAVLKVVCRTCNLSTLKKQRNSEGGGKAETLSLERYSTSSTSLVDDDWIE
jgi:hypothetical protein